MIVNGYQSTVFHYENIIIKLKIPDFQLKVLFTENELKQPIKIDKLYSNFLGLCLEINGKAYLHRLPYAHENFKPTTVKDITGYLLAWWEWYKPQRAEELLELIKNRKETIKSIVLNEESIFLHTEPLNTFINSKAFMDNYINIKTKIFPNKHYQQYREAIHYKTIYGESIENENLELFRKDIKYSTYPRLYQDPKQAGPRKNRILHTWNNYGTHTDEFIKFHKQKYIEDHKIQIKDEDLTLSHEAWKILINSKKFDLDKNRDYSTEYIKSYFAAISLNNDKVNALRKTVLEKRAEDNYINLASNSVSNPFHRPIALIVDQITIEQGPITY